MSKAEKKISRTENRRHKKKKKYLYIFIPLFIIIIIVGGYGGVMWYKAASIVGDSYQDDGREFGSDLRDDLVDPTVDDVSILFIGIDKGETRAQTNSGNGLSDSLMLTTFNKDEKSVKVLNIPRDSYVYVPYVGYRTKINHAHSYGGANETIKTVENLFDIPVDYYVRVNFDAFIDIVDALNGINVDVPYEMFEMDSTDKPDAIHLLPGEQLLNGEEALALARTRKYDSDIERGKRQQEIMLAMVKRAVSFNSIINLEKIMLALGNNMSTNMEFNDLTSFGSYAMSGKLDIETLNLEGSDLWTDAYYYQLDEESVAENQQILKDHLGLTTP